MSHKKHKKSKQNQVDALSRSAKVGLIATATCATTGYVMAALSDSNCCDIPNRLGPIVPGLFTTLASPLVGVLAAGASELYLPVKEEIVEKYKDFKKLPVTQQVILGIAAYNILVGIGVGGSYFVIPNAAASEYLFDAALHFLNAYALNSENKFIDAIAWSGNIARMLQIDTLLSAGTSTIPKALNLIDNLNHYSTIFGLGKKWFSESASDAQPMVGNVQQESAQSSSITHNICK